MAPIVQEDLVSLQDVPGLLPFMPNGKRRSVDTIRKWIARGVHGVKLRSTKIGGTVYVSREALADFIEQTNGTEAE